MPLPFAAVVEWSALLEVILVSLVAGVGVTAVFSIAVAGAVCFVDFRREGRRAAATAFAALAVIAIAACVAAVASGIAVMVTA
jgi:hypothetical protein